MIFLCFYLNSHSDPLICVLQWTLTAAVGVSVLNGGVKFGDFLALRIPRVPPLLVWPALLVCHSFMHE
jgi:hypothetical protein